MRERRWAVLLGSVRGPCTKAPFEIWKGTFETLCEHALRKHGRCAGSGSTDRDDAITLAHVLPLGLPSRERAVRMSEGDRSQTSAVRQLDPLPFTQRLACSALRAGPIPEHVAIIMDGNRRFAEKKQVSRAAGHALGYEKVLTRISGMQALLRVLS